MATQSTSGYMKFLDMVGKSPTYNPPFSTGFGTSESVQAAMQRAAAETYSAQSMSNKARQKQIEWAIDMANRERGVEGLNINNLPNFGSSLGGGAGGATLRANPFEGRLMNLLNDPSSLANDPGYKFEMEQGQQALARSAAAKGMTGSGNTLAELLRQGQGFASMKRGQEIDRLGGLMQGRDQTNANLYGTDVGAATSRYGTDIGSQTSMWNTAQKINADNYWNTQKMASGIRPSWS